MDRLSVLLGCVAIGFAADRVVQLPVKRFGWDVLGSPLGLALSARWLVITFVLGLVVTGVAALLHSHPLCLRQPVRHTPLFWILPGMTTLATGLFLARTADLLTWSAGLLGAAALLGLVIASEYRSLDPVELERPGMQLFSTLMVTALAFFLLALIYGAQIRTLLMGPAVFLVTGLLALRLFWNSSPASGGRLVYYAAAVGLIIAQAAWAMNTWPLGSLAGGASLLLLFYLATGIAQQSLLGRMGRRTWLEYGLVALLAAAAILLFST